MFSVHTNAAALVLLLNETCTVSLESFLHLPSGAESKNSPCRRIRAEPALGRSSNTSFGQERRDSFYTNSFA